jgi:hypothetical protein
MTKHFLAGLAILALSTSAASAWTHRTTHSRAMNPNASAAAMNPNPSARSMNAYAAMGTPPPAAMPGVSSKDHDMHMKNLRDSGYDPKNDFNAAGNVVNQ